MKNLQSLKKERNIGSLLILNKMKKLLICLLLILLVGCKGDEVISDSAKEKYLDMINQIQEHSDFLEESELFDLTYEITSIDDGYRFYVIIDNVKTAMYDIKAIAIEKDVDYTDYMAANIGIFEENRYSLIPNQYNATDGFMKGISISGLSNKDNPTIYLLVEWNNQDLSKTYRQYFMISNKETNE